MNHSHSLSSEEIFLDHIQRRAFGYFLQHANPENGLVADSSRSSSPASIAATGFALSAYPVAVERNWLKHEKALRLTLATLRFFARSSQSGKRDSSGHRGFYFHFLDRARGLRAWKSELSSIDTALLLMGAVTAAAYFAADTADEREVRELALELCERADWNWMCNGHEAVGHGWKPERGFLVSQWTGYNEALLLYILGLGSQSHPLPAASYAAWTAPFRWKTIYGHEFVYAGPLFIHQMAQCWLDLRNMRDDYMRVKNSDYFQNSRRATLVQREYAVRNPRGFKGYGPNSWGITASDGPGPQSHVVAGRQRRFHGYRARGVPYGPDDGTLSPWVVAASLPFCPEVVLPALRHFDSLALSQNPHSSFEATFNPTHPERGAHGWVSSAQLGVNQGPIVLMIENYRTGFVWDLLRDHALIARGLKRAGFARK